MTAAWHFHNPVHVRFGPGVRAEIAPQVAGRRILAVSTARGRRQMESDPLIVGALNQAQAVSWMDGVTSNPGFHDIQIEIDRLAEENFDLILAFGGGSALDVAKALAAGLGSGVSDRDLVALITHPERIGRGESLPIVAIATTSGTGAEVTPFATVWDHVAKKKLSLAGPDLFPKLAIIDPELTWSLPLEPTLSTGLDALNQAFESVWNRNRNPLTLMMAGRAIRLGMAALPRLAADLEDHEARAEMSEASLLAGLCISQTRTAICHAISYPLTAYFGLPHGFACAFSMAEVARQVRDEEPATLNAVTPFTGFADARALVARLEALLEEIGLRRAVAAFLPAAGAEPLLALRHEMFTPGRSDNFVLPVTPDRLVAILTASAIHPLIQSGAV